MPPHMSVTYVEISSAGPFLLSHDVPLRTSSTLILHRPVKYQGCTDTITVGQVRFATATRPPILDFVESSTRVERAKFTLSLFLPDSARL